MAATGMDAAEGDEDRTPVGSVRELGWRLPSTARSTSAIPGSWTSTDGVPATSDRADVPEPPPGADEAAAPSRGWRRLRLLRRDRNVIGRDVIGHDLIRADDDRIGSLDVPDPGPDPDVEADLELDLAREPEPAVSVTDPDDVFSSLADEVAVRELQVELRERVERERAVLDRREQLESTTSTASRIHLIDLTVDEDQADGPQLEEEFWAEGSTMSPGWLSRRKRRDELEAAVDDEPMEMLDLSAYDVPPERRGAFRDAVAAGGERDAASRADPEASEPSAG